MRLHPIQRLPLLSMFCLVILALPVIAHAETYQTHTINGAEVRVLSKDGKNYIANKGPGPLVLRYPNGEVMCTIPAGGSMMLGGFSGLSIGTDGIQVGKPIAFQTRQMPNGRYKNYFNVTIIVGSNTPSPGITINSPLGSGPVATYEPGYGIDKVAKAKTRNFRSVRMKNRTFENVLSKTKEQDFTNSEDDRTLISLSN